ncbi:MAG: Gfo/Idh/MocA family oxidoreductase [Phycisphaerae bacterium]|nr:Gfo/Idh/MocA family oxidoreductase [Phycisphaerae bacterium]
MTSESKTKKGLPLNISRRRFLQQASAAAVSATIVPRHVLGGAGYTPPSETLNVAIIGTGGQGLHNMRALLQEKDVQIVAVADVMEEADYRQFYYGGTAGRIPALKMVDGKNAERPSTGPAKKCRGYVDFREMLDTEKSIDAVLIATPDHMHCVTSLAAIGRGKHVYCEKPLARTVYETRRVTEAAREAKVATQMGNHGHSGSGIRMTVEWIRDGVIGDVREVHSWSDGASSPEFRGRPKETPPIPAGLNWDLWLGPAARRPYHPTYAPYRWRQWWDFGTGTLGDMACHNMDPAFWALDLGHPTSVEARCAGLNSDTVPYAATVYYQFPARGSKPPVKLVWYSGLKPPRPEEMDPNRDLIGGGNGILFVGDKGKIMCEGWAGSPRLVPMEKTREYKKPAASIPRSKGHHRDWIDACKGGSPASSNFDYSGHLAEVVLLGNVAMRAEKKILWDGPNMTALNCPEAAAFIRPEYHNGWTL